MHERLDTHTRTHARMYTHIYAHTLGNEGH